MVGRNTDKVNAGVGGGGLHAGVSQLFRKHHVTRLCQRKQKTQNGCLRAGKNHEPFAVRRRNSSRIHAATALRSSMVPLGCW